MIPFGWVRTGRLWQPCRLPLPPADYARTGPDQLDPSATANVTNCGVPRRRQGARASARAGPSAVIATVNSKCAVSDPSSRVDRPAVVAGAHAGPAGGGHRLDREHHPLDAARGPVPGSPKLGICGSSCMLRPTPWPTSVRTIASPRASAAAWIACETSPRRLPTTHCSIAGEERVARCPRAASARERARAGRPRTCARRRRPSRRASRRRRARSRRRARARRARDAVHDHRVRRGADRRREAVVALEGRHAALGADVAARRRRRARRS